jgi:hypothetical protein
VRPAELGKADAEPASWKALESHPEVWPIFGDRGKQALETWLQMIAGPDLLLPESLRCKVENLRKELLEPQPSSLERFLVEGKSALVHIGARRRRGLHEAGIHRFVGVTNR